MTWTARLPRHIVNQLLHHAQQSPDGEVCGLIGSKGGLPSHCYPIANIATIPQRLFAIYHSHPVGPSIPSATDLAQANYPETLYLIISMQTRGVLEMQGFLLDGDTITEVPLEIIE